ncbi:MAG: LysM peptidoglycan-binding domain-containing protein [Oscillibacter sp.]|nr:LysM peptidoglycan-binding domain-containing protein [Oscillibacter sp.]MBD5170305.1 LysM peptidoglycan-binding domain-containing protein [Oscillibacter sp.]
MEIHVVQAGETLYGIAGQYGVDPVLLEELNGVPPGGALAVGQTLVIRRVDTFHTVQSGQTLDSIARQYGVPLRQLYRNNYHLGGNPTIQPGQTLVIAYQDRPTSATHTNGYAYPFITRALLSAELPYMSYLTPFTYGITASGGLLPLADEMLLSEAARLGTVPLMHLSTLTETDNFSSERAVQVLTDLPLQAALIDQIVATITEKDYRGLDVDFEYIPGAQRENYAAFIRTLRERLAPMGLPVIVALAPKTYAQQPGLLYEAHDYALLGAAADFVLLMTYEWGYTAGPPMAVSPLPNVRQVLDYAVTEIPREKIYLGISNYGYDWPLPFRQGVTRARSISNQEAVELALRYGAEIQFDQTAQSPWFNYTAPDGTPHVVWFEDARSMSAKLRLIDEYGLYGAGYWNLMRPYPQGWAVLNALYQVADG